MQSESSYHAPYGHFLYYSFGVGLGAGGIMTSLSGSQFVSYLRAYTG